MKITNATGSWASVTLSADEVWQVWEGAFAVDTEATEADRLGIRMFPNDSMKFTSGKTVYYRLLSGTSGSMARVAP